MIWNILYALRFLCKAFKRNDAVLEGSCLCRQQAARQLGRFWKRASVLFELNVTENIGRQPPTDCVNTLPEQLLLNASNAEHFRPRDIQKVKEGAETEKRCFQMNHWEHKQSEHLVLHQLCHTEQEVMLRIFISI